MPIAAGTWLGGNCSISSWACCLSAAITKLFYTATFAPYPLNFPAWLAFAGRNALSLPKGVPAPHFSVERVGYGDAKVFLAGVEIFGPDPLTAGAFRGSDDHAVVEVQAIGSPRFDGTSYGVVIG